VGRKLFNLLTLLSLLLGMLSATVWLRARTIHDTLRHRTAPLFGLMQPMDSENDRAT
jgi:hypothetical protein